jgi:hypothetical protein
MIMQRASLIKHLGNKPSSARIIKWISVAALLFLARMSDWAL